MNGTEFEAPEPDLVSASSPETNLAAWIRDHVVPLLEEPE